MSQSIEARIAAATGAHQVSPAERIQSLWGGYGEAARYRLGGGEHPSVVTKHVHPGAGSGRSHDRKLRSYEVERAWYSDWSARCPASCRVPRPILIEQVQGEWLFVLEDLQGAGFPKRSSHLDRTRLATCLRWLAAFHATFLGERPRGLWRTGTYWHLKTRPDEHRAMGRGPLRDAAAAIDARLSGARHLTLVHGDAKPDNFCFSADGQRAAAVDFQYVGGGCGVKDVAYLLAGEDATTVSEGLDLYFKALRDALPPTVGREVEAEWRELYPWAWADFQRFLAGWAPGWRIQRHEQALTDRVLGARATR